MRIERGRPVLVVLVLVGFSGSGEEGWVDAIASWEADLKADREAVL